MKMKSVKIFVIALIGVLLSLSFFTGCASKESKTADRDIAYETRGMTTMATTAGIVSGRSQSADGASSAAAPKDDAYDRVLDATGSVSLSSSSGSGSGFSAYNAILADRKVIFNANITVEVEDFNESYGKIQSIISGNGFVQNSNVTKDRYYDEDGNEKYTSRGVIVIRVAREKFDTVLANIKGLGNVLEENIYTDDVTDKYFDVESRLKILRLEEERLLAYLADIKDPETIFKYEKRLTEVRQEIESYTGTLRKWDNLVELSTITINLREVRPDNNPRVSSIKKTYWQKLADKFVSSLKGTIKFLGNVVIFLAQVLPALVFLGLAFIAFYLVIRFVRKQLGRIKENEIRNKS